MSLPSKRMVCPKCGHVLWVTPRASAVCGACPKKGRDRAPLYIEENDEG